VSRLSRLGKGRAPSVANATLFALLAVYAAAVVLWLVVGLVPALADASPSFETTLRSWGYGQDRFAALARNAIAAVADVRHGAQVAVQYAFSLVNLALAIFLMWRRPRDTTARLLAVAMLGTAAAFNLQAHSTRAIATPVFSWVDAWHDLFHVLSGVAYVYAVLLFPDGKLVPRLPRWAQIVLYGVGTFFVANVSLGGTTSVATHPDFFVGFFGLLIPVVGVLAQRYRYRRASSVESRQQARLLLWALVPAFCVGAVSVIAGADDDAMFLVFAPLFAVVPIVLFVGILRYRLWDIDLVINKTLLYGSLASFIALVYVVVVVGVASAVGRRGEPNAALSIAATAIVAVTIQPVRERLQRLANRLVYGKRATPYEVLSRFSERVAETYATEHVAARMARMLVEGTGAVRADVWLRVGGALHLAASWPEQARPEVEPVPLEPTEDLPWISDVSRTKAVQHHGELLGALALTKAPGEPLSSADDRLLADLASQAGVVLSNVRLTAELETRLEELQASRQRIVEAAYDARRRIERDLHDGAQQHFVALSVNLRLARELAEEDPNAAKVMLDQLAADLREAVQALRDLSHGIYPPLLADGGLVPALSAAATRSPIAVEMTAGEVGRHSPDIEAAVYFCCLEALQNAGKHAGAGTRVTVGLWEHDGALHLEIADNGAGFDPVQAGPGAGLVNMSDRLEALGGSVRIESKPGRGTVVTGTVAIAI